VDLDERQVARRASNWDAERPRAASPRRLLLRRRANPRLRHRRTLAAWAIRPALPVAPGDAAVAAESPGTALAPTRSLPL
jgi:hypothetical protein